MFGVNRDSKLQQSSYELALSMRGSPGKYPVDTEPEADASGVDTKSAIEPGSVTDFVDSASLQRRSLGRSHICPIGLVARVGLETAA